MTGRLESRPGRLQWMVDDGWIGVFLTISNCMADPPFRTLEDHDEAIDIDRDDYNLHGFSLYQCT